MELTEIFPPEIKPVHVGVYPTFFDDDDAQIYNHWNGEYWGMADYTVDGAEAGASFPSITQDVSWRGLAKKAE